MKRLVAWVLTGMMVVVPTLADSGIVVQAAGISAETAYTAEASATVSGNDAEVLEEVEITEETDPEDVVPEEIVWYGSAQSESEVTLPTVDVPDEEELFTGYAEQILYADLGLEENLTVYTQEPYNVRSLAYPEGTLEDLVYDYLKEQSVLVANGKLASACFEIPLSDFLGEDVYYTAEDLGVDSLLNQNGITDEAVDAMMEKVSYDSLSVLNSLLVDIPYELYWFDKTGTGGMGINDHIVICGQSTGEEALYFSSDSALGIALYVASAYSADGTTGTTDVDTGKTGAASAAAANAAAVVNTATGYSDYEKVVYYKEYICDAVEYNYDALEDGVEYGDPWQLIYVFDGNTETNVVCEGYSKALKYLCDLSAFSSSLVECRIVDGVMQTDCSQGPHMWNVMAMDDGKNYLVDVTNCDAGSIGADEKLFLVGSTGTLSGTATDSAGNTVTVPGYYITIDGTNVNYLYEASILSLYTEKERSIATSGYEVGHTIVTGVALNWESLRIEVGDTWTLAATVEPSTAANPSVTWSSSDESVATVDASGIVTAVGWGTATITATTNDGGHTASCTVKVAPPIKYIDTLTISAIKDQTYTGSAIKPAITIKDGDTVLKKGTDYTVSYSNNTKVGTATVKITGVENYQGTITKTFKITAASVAKATVTLSANSYSFTNAAKKPSVTVKVGSRTLTKGTDYTVSYSNNVNIGTATVTITGKGNYTGTVSKTFTIKAPAKGATFTVNNIKYKVTDASALTLSVVGASSKSITSLVIPKTVSVGKTYKVTAVAANAFKGYTKLTKVTIGQNVKTIGNNAFYGCTALKTLTINTKVSMTIGKKAFYGCKALTTLKTGNYVTSIGDGAFQKCTGLTTVTIGTKVKTIGASAFKGCTAMTKFTCNSTVLKTIGKQAFNGDKKLKTIVFKSQKITKVGTKAFSGVPANATVKVPSAKVSSYTKLFQKAGLSKSVKVKK